VQPLLKQMHEAKGVLVGNVLPDSPALKAGLQAGDFIGDYNGVAVAESRAPEDIPLFNRMILNTPVGAKVYSQRCPRRETHHWTLTTIDAEPNEALEGNCSSGLMTTRDFNAAVGLGKSTSKSCRVLVDSVRAGAAAAEAKLHCATVM
jgi:hypothetical protein